MYTYALFAPSAVGIGIEYEQVGLDATDELVHHEPPVQAPFAIACVLQTSNFTVFPSVVSDAVAVQVTEVPGFLGLLLLIAVNVGAWFTINGEPLAPLPCDDAEHADELVFASQTKAYQLLVYGSAAFVVYEQLVAVPEAVELLTQYRVPAHVGAPPLVPAVTELVLQITK